MVVRDVGADKKDYVCVLHIRIRAGWTVGAEGKLVAGDGGRHAQRSVAVVVTSAKAELHEFAKGVTLLCEELPVLMMPSASLPWRS